MKGNEEAKWKGVEDMARSKRERRMDLARLSFEEKIRILLQLQRMAVGVSKAVGRSAHAVWKV